MRELSLYDAGKESRSQARTFIPSLEGVRGYAFLAVFAAHYVSATVVSNYSARPWVQLVKLAFAPVWISVPIFFVLSGYLICGILIDTREREGYFKIFYSRRILRVFPLYYITLAAVGLSVAAHGGVLGRWYWLHYFYIHNLFRGYISSFNSAPGSQLSHLWSMGVEEQFYMVWPLVVWMCANRRVLLRVTLALIAVSFALRLAGPLFDPQPWFFYYWSPTRIDAILLGAALAALRGEKITLQLKRIAKYAAFAGIAILYLFAAVQHNDGSYSGYLGYVFLIPLWNLCAAAVVVAVMQEGSVLCRLCSGKRIRWLGARSYALYLFHLTYSGWFADRAVPFLEQFMGAEWAIPLTIVAAFAFTVFLAAVSYRLIEEPAMNLKKRLKYGPEKLFVQMEPAVPSGD